MKLLLSVLLTLPGFAQAQAPQEILALIPPGFDLAKTFHQKNDPELTDSTDGSYLIFDFNNDGYQDVALMIEETIKNTETPEFSEYGATNRAMQIYLGSEWGYEFAAENNVAVMGFGDGGASSLYDDPFQGFSVNAKGTLLVEYYGGSSSKWGYKLKFQWRKADGKADFYYVGRTEIQQGYDASLDQSIETKYDENLITGDRLKNIYELYTENDEEVLISSTHSKSKPAPLVSFENVTKDQAFYWNP